MRGIRMINIEGFPIFQNHLFPLKELSKDNSDKANIVYMTNSEMLAVDFDQVKTQYANGLGLSEEVASSCDAITYHTSHVTFIEFKNGNMKNAKANVKSKIKDSLLIFCDLTNTKIADTREKVDFILVYNQQKNPVSNQEKNSIADSKSRDAIAKYFLAKGKQELIRFDLERFQKLYFRKVHTYTEEEFEKHFVNLL